MIAAAQRSVVWAILLGWAFTLDGGLARAGAATPTVLWDESLFAHLTPAEREILHEYYQAYWELKAYYENIRMTARGELWHVPKAADGISPMPPGTPLEQRERIAFTFAARKSQEFRLEGRWYRPERPEELLGGRIGVLNADGGFMFGIDRRTNQPFLEAHNKNRQEALDLMGMHIFMVAPFSAENRLLEQILFSAAERWPLETVERLEPDAEVPRETVQLTFRFQGESGFSVHRLRLDSTRRWVTLSDERLRTTTDHRDVPESTTRFRCEYAESNDPFPRLQRVTSEAYAGHPPLEGRVPVDRRVYIIDELKPGEPPAELFDHRPLDTQRLGPAGLTAATTRVLLLFNGIGLLAFGYWLVSRRRQPGPTEPSNGSLPP